MRRVEGGGTEMRNGTFPDYVQSQKFNWVPHQVRKGDLVLIHDMVRNYYIVRFLELWLNRLTK